MGELVGLVGELVGLVGGCPLTKNIGDSLPKQLVGEFVGLVGESVGLVGEPINWAGLPTNQNIEIPYQNS